MNPVLTWVDSHPAPTAAGAALLLAALLLPLLRGRRPRPERTPAAVIVAALGALVCTAYSGDTSWGFARDHLGMTTVEERSTMFLAAELALFACALMARQNLRTTGAPGTPGALVWFITAVQVIPAYAESGIVGGTVRAIVGPVMAAMLWHLAMGIELRHGSGGGSQSLPAVIARELRERLLSRLGLAARDRTAAQITRDRATARAVQLASRPNLHRWGRARLAAAVARSGVGTDREQLDVMMRMLAARRGAGRLSSVELRSPFEPDVPEVAVEVQRVPDVPEAYPEIEVHVPAVPEAVPAGARLLPTATACGLPPQRPELVASDPEPEPEVPVLGLEVRPPFRGLVPTGAPLRAQPAEHPEPEDDDPVYPDPLIPQVRLDFPDEVPGVRRLKEQYGIGQARAQRIRDQLAGVPS
ncbi:hypothetical protein [Streptomyces sp. NPDC003483]